MSPTIDPAPGAGAAWCRRFIERRCGAASAPLVEEHDADETEVASRSVALSLAEADLGDDATGAAVDEYLAVLALTLPEKRLALRFVSPSSMRSASRSVGARRLVTDVSIRTPDALDEVSLLIYRIHPTLAGHRALAAIETTIELFDAAPDDDDLVLGRGLLEQLETLDADHDAAIVVSGRGLPVGTRSSSRKVREVAVVATPPGTAPLGELRFGDRTLMDRSTGLRLQGRAYATLRFGPRSTRESVLELIDEIRRRHQRQAQAGAGSESFELFLDRQASETKAKTIEAMFAHNEMLPVVTPIAVEVARNLEMVSGDESSPGLLRPRWVATQSELQRSFGISIPGLRMRLNEAELPNGTYIIMLDEIPLVSGSLATDKLLCLADAYVVGDAEETTVPDGSGRPACWIPAARGEEVHRAGFETWDAGAYIEAHLRSLIVANLNLFATTDLIERRLDEAAETDGAFLDKIHAAPGGLPRFVEVMHALLVEQLPIVPIAPLATRYLDLVDRPPDRIVEDLRLCPDVLARLTSDASTWKLFALDAGFEATVRGGITRDGDASLLSLEPEPTQELLTAVRKECGAPADGTVRVLLVEDHELRPFIRSLIELELPGLRVVTRRELEHVAGLPAPAATISVHS